MQSSEEVQLLLGEDTVGGEPPESLAEGIHSYAAK